MEKMTSEKMAGMNAPAGPYPEISTPHKPITPEQIEEHCNSIVDNYICSRDDRTLLFSSVQIIKQLQSELMIRQQGYDGD